MRSLYPGNPDLTAFDYLLPESGDTKNALLCICRSDVLEQHRIAAGGSGLAVPLSLLIPHLAGYRGKKLAYLYFGERSIEVDLFDDCILHSSTVVSRNDNGQFDAVDVAEMIAAWDTRVVHAVIQNPDDAGARQVSAAFKGELEHFEIADVLTASEGMPKRRPLFQSSRRTDGRVFGIAARAVAVLMFLFVALLGHKAVVREDRFAGYLQNELAAAENMAAASQNLESEVELLREELAELGLQLSESAQPYVVLSELTEVFGGDVQIDTFLLERVFFRVEAVAANPLMVMQRFDAHPRFANLRVTQLLQERDSDLVRFTLTGDYHGG